jgi:hypothetical protein
VVNSNLPPLNISKQEITMTIGHKIVLITNMIKDKNLSSGEDVGLRREKVNQLVRK